MILIAFFVVLRVTSGKTICLNDADRGELLLFTLAQE